MNTYIKDFVNKLNMSGGTLFLFGDKPVAMKVYNKDELTYDEYLSFIDRHSDTNIWYLPSIDDKTLDIIKINRSNKRTYRPKTIDMSYRNFMTFDFDDKDLNKRNSYDILLKHNIDKECLYILDSGNGLQVCYYFKTGLNKKEYKKIYSDKFKYFKSIGLKPDSHVSSIVALSRLPLSFNHKYNKKKTILIKYNINNNFNESIVPKGYSLKQWKKKSDKDKEEFKKKNRSKKIWKVVHGHMKGHIGQNVYKNSDEPYTTYDKARKRLTAIVMTKG